MNVSVKRSLLAVVASVAVLTLLGLSSVKRDEGLVVPTAVSASREPAVLTRPYDAVQGLGAVQDSAGELVAVSESTTESPATVDNNVISISRAESHGNFLNDSRIEALRREYLKERLRKEYRRRRKANIGLDRLPPWKESDGVLVNGKVLTRGNVDSKRQLLGKEQYYAAMRARRALLAQGSPSVRRRSVFRPFIPENNTWLQRISDARHHPLYEKWSRYNAMRFSAYAVEHFNRQSNISLPKLNRRDIDGVEKFVFFIGYPRSGHSIIGSMMDAHPNMVVSHEFMLFERMTKNPYIAWMLGNRTVLFNALYRKSYTDARTGVRSPGKDRKGYTLQVDTPWYGAFNGSLRVLGDKSGGQTVIAYLRNKFTFEKVLTRLRDTVQIPIHVIHVVRNPYDMIATGTLYHSRTNGTGLLHHKVARGEVNETSLKTVFKDPLSHTMQVYSRFLLRLAYAVPLMVSEFNLNVLDVHSADLVKDPRKTISRICTFLDLPCPEDYLQACYDKTYKTESKSRNLVLWPERVRAEVEGSIQNIPFFRRYTFEGD